MNAALKEKLSLANTRDWNTLMWLVTRIVNKEHFRFQ